MTKYAAYDECSIYGTGASALEAIANARDGVKDEEAEFKTAKITDEFYDDIEANGWDGSKDSFSLDDNGFLTRDLKGS